MGIGDFWKDVKKATSSVAKGGAKYVNSVTNQGFNTLNAFTPAGMLQPFSQLLSQNPLFTSLLGVGALALGVFVLIMIIRK